MGFQHELKNNVQNQLSTTWGGGGNHLLPQISPNHFHYIWYRWYELIQLPHFSSFLHFKVSAQIRQHSGYWWTHKKLSSQKFNEYFHRTSLIKLTQVCFLSLPTQKVSAHCTRNTTLYLYSISCYMQYSTWTSVFSVLKTSCIWSLKPRDNISSASSKTNNFMLLVP